MVSTAIIMTMIMTMVIMGVLMEEEAASLQLHPVPRLLQEVGRSAIVHMACSLQRGCLTVIPFLKLHVDVAACLIGLVGQVAGVAAEVQQVRPMQGLDTPCTQHPVCSSYESLQWAPMLG